MPSGDPLADAPEAVESADKLVLVRSELEFAQPPLPETAIQYGERTMNKAVRSKGLVDCQQWILLDGLLELVSRQYAAASENWLCVPRRGEVGVPLCRIAKVGTLVRGAQASLELVPLNVEPQRAEAPLLFAVHPDPAAALRVVRLPITGDAELNMTRYRWREQRFDSLLGLAPLQLGFSVESRFWRRRLSRLAGPTVGFHLSRAAIHGCGRAVSTMHAGTATPSNVAGS